MDEGRQKEKRKFGEDLPLRKKISIFVNSSSGQGKAAGLYEFVIDIPLNSFHADFYKEPPPPTPEPPQSPIYSKKKHPKPPEFHDYSKYDVVEEDPYDEDIDDDDGDLLKYPQAITWPYCSSPLPVYDDDKNKPKTPDSSDVMSSSTSGGGSNLKPITKSDYAPDPDSLISSNSSKLLLVQQGEIAQTSEPIPKSASEVYIDIPPPIGDPINQTDTNFGDCYKKAISELRHEICKFLRHDQAMTDSFLVSIYKEVTEHEAKYRHTQIVAHERSRTLVSCYKKLHRKLADDICKSLSIGVELPRSVFTEMYMIICKLEARFPNDKKTVPELYQCFFREDDEDVAEDDAEDDCYQKPVVPVVPVSANVHGYLKPVETFYRRCYQIIYCVAACLLDDNTLYMIPHDYETIPRTTYPNPNRLSPILYNLKSKTSTLGLLLSAKKMNPIVIAIKHTIFAISAETYNVPKPSFEYLDLKHLDMGWQELPSSPVHKDYKPGYRISGHVLVENNLLISLHKYPDDFIYYSFNIETREWSTVADNGLKLTLIDSLAVVMNGHIYTYNPEQRKLFLFSYANVINTKVPGDAESVGLSLGPASVVKGLKFDEFPDTFREEEFFFLNSGAIAIVEDQILCVLQTKSHVFSRDQPVCVSIIRLEKGDCCTTLMAFTSFLVVGDDFVEPRIKFCFIRDTKKTSGYGKSVKKQKMVHNSRSKQSVTMGHGEDDIASERR